MIPDRIDRALLAASSLRILVSWIRHASFIDSPFLVISSQESFPKSPEIIS